MEEDIHYRTVSGRRYTLQERVSGRRYTLQESEWKKIYTRGE